MIKTINKKILPGFSVSPKIPWQQSVNQLSQLQVLETALLLADSFLEDRRALYRLLKETPLASVPFVQLAFDMEEWELAYLTEEFGTEIFALPTKNRTFGLLARLDNYAPRFVFENPVESQDRDLFTDEVLTRAKINGVCLDVAVLERDRQHDEQKYNKTVQTLDHHPLRATKIGPVPNAWYKKIIKGWDRRLTSLTELSYLKHLPATYVAPLIILAVDNLIEEQLEVKSYLESLLK